MSRGTLHRRGRSVRLGQGHADARGARARGRTSSPRGASSRARRTTRPRSSTASARPRSPARVPPAGSRWTGGRTGFAMPSRPPSSAISPPDGTSSRTCRVGRSMPRGSGSGHSWRWSSPPRPRCWSAGSPRGGARKRAPSPRGCAAPPMRGRMAATSSSSTMAERWRPASAPFSRRCLRRSWRARGSGQSIAADDAEVPGLALAEHADLGHRQRRRAERRGHAGQRVEHVVAHPRARARRSASDETGTRPARKDSPKWRGTPPAGARGRARGAGRARARRVARGSASRSRTQAAAERAERRCRAPRARARRSARSGPARASAPGRARCLAPAPGDGAIELGEPGPLAQPEGRLQRAVKAIAARRRRDLADRRGQFRPVRMLAGMRRELARLGVPAEPARAEPRECRAARRGPEDGKAAKGGHGGLRCRKRPHTGRHASRNSDDSMRCRSRHREICG